MAEVSASEVRRVLDLLSDRAVAAWPVVGDGAGGLSLADAGAAVESLVQVLESVWQLLGPVMERVAQIHEREMGERRDGRGRELTERAWVHLDCGRDGVMVASHLLSTGRGDLLTVERGED